MLRRVTTLLRPVATKRTTKTTSLFSVRSSRAKTASNLTQTRTFLGLFNNNKKIEVRINNRITLGSNLRRGQNSRDDNNHLIFGRKSFIILPALLSYFIIFYNYSTKNLVKRQQWNWSLKCLQLKLKVVLPHVTEVRIIMWRTNGHELL